MDFVEDGAQLLTAIRNYDWAQYGRLDLSAAKQVADSFLKRSPGL
jgi:hypothetical protein